MLHSEFWQAVDTVFGEVRGRSLAHDLVLLPWNLTAQEALAAGFAPQQVWDSLRMALDIGEEWRFPHRKTRHAAKTLSSNRRS